MHFGIPNYKKHLYFVYTYFRHDCLRIDNCLFSSYSFWNLPIPITCLSVSIRSTSQLQLKWWKNCDYNIIVSLYSNKSIPERKKKTDRNYICNITKSCVREESKKNGIFMVFDHNWGGGQPKPYPYCKTPLFFKTLYTSSIILNL